MILHKFLGVVLSPTFPVQPDVAVAELVFDLVMQLTSSYMLFLTYRALTRTDDILFFGSICLNRFVAVLDTIMLLAVDNASSSFLVHFSFVRSLVRYLALCIAVGYMSQRRVLRASRLVLRTHEELLSYFILGIAILAVLIGGGTVVAYFVSSLIAVSASDSLLDARPNASASEVLRAQTLAVSDVPPEMFEVMMAVNFPVIHGLQILIDGFFYTVISGMWATTFINVRKLTARNWALISLPYLATLLLHLLVMVLTAISRAGSPIEFVVELGQFAFAVDWYIFINKTEPLLRDVQATEVDVSVMSSQSGGSGGGNRSRQGSRARPVIVTKGRNPPKREVIYQKKSLPPTPLSPTSLTSGNGMPLSSASSGGAAAAARAMAAHEDILGTAVLPTTMMPASQMMGMSPPSQPLSPALSQPAGVYFARPATPGTTPGTTPQGLYASHKHMLGAGLSISPNSGKSFMTAHTSSGGGSRGSASMSRQGTDSSTRGSMAPEVSEQYELSNYYSMDRKEPSPPQQQQQQQPQKQQHQRQLSSSSFTKPATSPLPIAAGSDPAWRFLSSLQSSQQLLASEDDAGQYHAGLALGDDGATSVAGVSGSTVMGPLSRESMMGRRSVPLATPEPAAVAAVATATAAVPAGAAVPPTYDSFEVEEYIELSDTAGSRERPSRRSTSDFTVHAYSTMPATVSTVSSPPLPRDAAAAAADVLLRASGTQPLSPQRQAYVQLQQQQHQQPAALFPLPQQLPAPPEYQAAEDRWRRARAEWEANTAAGDAAESGQLARPPHTMALGRAAAEGDTVLVLDDGDVPLRSPSGVPLAPFEVAEERWRRERAEWDRKQLEAVRAEAQNARRGIP